MDVDQTLMLGATVGSRDGHVWEGTEKGVPQFQDQFCFPQETGPFSPLYEYQEYMRVSRPYRYTRPCPGLPGLRWRSRIWRKLQTP